MMTSSLTGKIKRPKTGFSMRNWLCSKIIESASFLPAHIRLQWLAHAHVFTWIYYQIYTSAHAQRGGREHVKLTPTAPPTIGLQKIPLSQIRTGKMGRKNIPLYKFIGNYTKNIDIENETVLIIFIYRSESLATLRGAQIERACSPMYFVCVRVRECTCEVYSINARNLHSSFLASIKSNSWNGSERKRWKFKTSRHLESVCSYIVPVIARVVLRCCDFYYYIIIFFNFDWENFDSNDRFFLFSFILYLNHKCFRIKSYLHIDIGGSTIIL